MGQYIKTDKIRIGELGFGKHGIARKELLKGEVTGVETNYYIVGKDSIYHAHMEGKKIRVVFIIKGIGYIKTGDSIFTLSESAVFCPPANTSFIVRATTDNVEFLEILYELTQEELQELCGSGNKDSYFMNYSACSTYKEAIKSEKTVNRTLIPEGIAPRFCMGSVETTGPDIVGAHVHSMLEQFFYGLSDNYCYIRADDSEILFDGNALLHIPLGATHGVRVEEGHTLHYLWIDLFKSNDMSYIHESHIQHHGEER